jgi:transcriptional regulator with XRE-family HTH domain
MSQDKLEIAERIRVLRAKKHLKQNEIAKILGIKGQTLSMIERGEQYPTIPQISAIANFFEVSTDYLLLGK